MNPPLPLKIFKRTSAITKWVERFARITIFNSKHLSELANILYSFNIVLLTISYIVIYYYLYI